MGACWSSPVGDASQGVSVCPAAPANGASKPATGCPLGCAPTPLLEGKPLLAAGSTLPSLKDQDAEECPLPEGALQAPYEADRLRAVRALKLLGAPPQPKFEAITALMKQMFETPVAAVTLIDEDLHFISRAGDWACSAGRPGSFCDWILVPETPQLLIVENAAEDIRFRHNKFVAHEPYIRFYAGAPLVSSFERGHRYGTLCVFDFKPRRFDAAKYAMLAHFAEIVVREMEREMALQLQQLEMGKAKVAENHLMRAMDSFHEGILLLDFSSTSWRVLYANDAFRRAARLPHLLAGQAGGAPLDFWHLFTHVTAGRQGSYNEALLAMATGKDFSLKVRCMGTAGASSAPAAAGQLDSFDSEDGAGSRVLTIHFRPADAEQLRADMPHIGVPSWVDAAAAQEPRFDEDESLSMALPQGLTSSSSTGGESSGSGGAPQPHASRHGRPAYYFGILRAARDAGSLDGTQASSAAQSRSGTPSASPPPMDSDQLELIRAELGGSGSSAGGMEARILPSFIQMRPEVMQEVQLGPLIGTGSMGRCYRGMWQGGRVAVKIIDCWEPLPGAEPTSSHQAAEPAARGRQAAVVEALLGRSLSHPHIVTTFTHGMATEELRDSGKRHQQVWIVQELCNRGSLLDAVDKGLLQRDDGTPNLHTILLAAQEIAGACAYLHTHDVIHGDLSPSNVLLTSATKDARRWICKVCDFGLAKHVGSAKELQSSCFGTVTYMPPELLSSGKLSKAADVYSFGIMLQEMYYGRRAWLGTPPLRILSNVTAGILPFEVPGDAPPALASLMRRCLDLDPEQRPSFSTILSEVQELARSLAAKARATPPGGSPFAAGTPTRLSTEGAKQAVRGQAQAQGQAGRQQQPAAAAPAQASQPQQPAQAQQQQDKEWQQGTQVPALVPLVGSGGRSASVRPAAAVGMASPFAAVAATRGSSAVSPFATPPPASPK